MDERFECMSGDGTRLFVANESDKFKFYMQTEDNPMLSVQITNEQARELATKTLDELTSESVTT